MAYSATYATTIKASIEKAFNYLADIARHGEWGSTDDRMKISAEKPGPPAVGARYKADALLNGRENKSTVTITALEPPKRIAFDAEDSNSVFHHEFLLTQEGDGTRFERRVTMTKGPFYFPLVLRIFKSTVVKNYDGAMQNAKAKIEAGA
ncbi:MAG TPA: SRPBCC family protein [Candidatus Dormibacteraeota bacterium]|nr:SRPBCC family protein [Candidatus Dormibacteraeota bacterium]